MELSLNLIDNSEALLLGSSTFDKNGLPNTDISPIETPHISDQDSDSDAESRSENSSVAFSLMDDVVQKTFERSKPRWIKDPVISQWCNPEHRIHRVLSEVNNLYNSWRTVEPRPFELSPSPLWRDTAREMARVGLPWYNNQVNLPHEVDTSWPFHFKEFETQLLQAKGARVGDPNVSGYVTSYNEANLYCLRALQQELRAQFPNKRPVLVYDHFDDELITLARKLFGLQIHRISLSDTIDNLRQQLLDVTSNATRPIILAATLYNSAADYDNMSIVPQLSLTFPLILHVDAFRSFDYITAFPGVGGRQYLKLAVRNFKQSLQANDSSIIASTIVAGGLDFSRHDPAIALKPATLGAEPTRVSYIRSYDSILSGSRDAIAPLWLALCERRLGDCGLRDTCQYLESLRSYVLRILEDQSIFAITSPYSTDLIVQSCTDVQRKWLLGLGGTLTAKEDIILSINPYFSATKLYSLLHAGLPRDYDNHMGETIPRYKDFVSLYPIPQDVLDKLQIKVQLWQVTTRSIAGYPVHMGSYSALGPIIGLFWGLSIPKDWAERKSSEILSARMKAFGLVSPESREKFKGIFTNGSTMGNRFGIMTALEHFPDAFIYFSAETHYSVIKTLRDCDTLTNRYSQIRCASNGSILVEALVQQAAADQKRCIDSGTEYHMILLANMGTTFVGARDDLIAIYQNLSEAGIQISYIHVDGALDFGFDTCGIELGPCGALNSYGKPLVQGVTISHHKALGHMVSGEVLCFSPENQLPCPLSSLIPRAVFENWLYHEVYKPADMSLMLTSCRENASYLETGLKRINVATKRNNDSIIIVLERPPSWVIEEFSLRPEDEWVHLITMPYVSRETIDRFIEQLAHIEKQFSFAFSHIAPLLSDILERAIKLQRVRCCSDLAERVSKLTQPSVNGVYCHGTDSAGSIKSSRRGAISGVAMDEQDDIQIVFLAESNRDQSIHVGPLLFTRTHYLENLALRVPLEFLHDSLPYMVQEDVNIFRPKAEDVWSVPFDFDDDDEDILEGVIDRHRSAFPHKRYHFWPIDINKTLDDDVPPHWGLIVLHLAHRQDDDDDPAQPIDPLAGPYNYLESYAVINPDHGDAARGLEDDTANLLLSLLPRMGIEFDHATILNSPQLLLNAAAEEWSSGLRVFEMIRVWLDRLSEFYCQNPHAHDAAGFWAPHPGWINLDAVRSNMIGMAAATLNRAMDSTTRIAIEPILDGALQLNGEGVLTQTMMPDREQLGAFIPGRDRRHPALLRDNPEDAEDDDDDDNNLDEDTDSA
ncbi:hypothetical protein GQX73_g5252 [Xylaria multiplex]|uniref:Uncharacterized protein n=1 Tax=Xylaria multiplex TaxID=323545 RepID=A0A7C8MLS7_9PEZI|nr:hypothetical protein GQX73_g5252 [Xylaria multiplex]